MSKREILEIFARTAGFLTPDRIWLALQKQLDRRSVYSYLLRLKRQGLLETGPTTRTERGFARLKYFRSQT